MAGGKLVAEGFRERLTKAGNVVRDRREAYDLALQQRDELVVEAIDVHGLSQLQVAAMIGVRKGRINAILAASQASDEAAR